MNFSSQSTSHSPATLCRGQRQTRGFSLLEVAIALVIFVFGALAIVRIFPGALRVITVGGSRKIALDLNRGAMARVQSDSSTTPIATYDVGPSYSFGWQDGYPGDLSTNRPAEPRAVLGSTNRGYSLPRSSNLSDVDDSALGSVKAVIGEGALVQQSDDNTLYILTQFPISTDSEYRVQDEKDIDGVTVDAQGNLDFSDSRYADSGAPVPTSAPTAQYPLRYKRPLINYPSLRPTDPVVYSRSGVFYVTYKYSLGGRVWGVNDDPISLPGDEDDPYDPQNNYPRRWNNPQYGNRPGRVSSPLTANPGVVIPGLVKVHQRYAITSNSFGTTSTNTTTNDDAARGLIRLSTATILPPSIISEDGINLRPLRAGDKVTIDYLADWNRIIQEGVPDIVPEATPTPVPAAPPVPANSPLQMSLAAPFLENHANDAVYSLLYKKNTTNTTLLKGAWGEGGLATGSQGLLLPTNEDTRASRVTFDMSNTGSIARVSYRTRDQWAQQLSVAAASYKPSDFSGLSSGSGDAEPWRSYFFNYNNTNNNILYFHGSEAGKTVMVTYSYQTGNSPVVTMRNRLMTISDQAIPIAVGDHPASFGSPQTAVFACPLQLTDEEGNDLSGASTVSILGVRGASVTVRTAWLDGSRYTQSFLPATRPGTGAEAMP
jgi:hypothetical protein